MILNVSIMKIKVYNLCIYNYATTFESLLSHVNLLNGLARQKIPVAQWLERSNTRNLGFGIFGGQFYLTCPMFMTN